MQSEDLLSPAAGSLPPARRFQVVERWWMLGILLSLYILSQLDRMIISMLVHPIQEDLHLSDFQISLILGPAFGVFYAIFGLPLAWTADRYPRRILVSIGVAFWSLATSASGLASSFWQLFAARSCVGVGEASLTPAAYSLIADKFPPNRLATALAIYGMGPKLGQAAGYSIGALAIGFAASLGQISLPFVGDVKTWHITFFIVGAPGALMALLLYTFSEPKRGAMSVPRRYSDAGLKTFVVENRKLMTALLLGFGSITLISGAIDWTPTYLQRRFGIEATSYGPALGLVSVCAAGTVLLKGVAIDWLYARGVKDAHLRFYTWLLVPAGCVTALAYFAPSPLVFYVGYGLIQAAALGHTLYMSSVIQLIAPTRVRAQLSALFLFMVTIGTSLGPLAVAGLTDFVFLDPAKIGWSLAIVCTVAVSMALISLRVALRLIRPLIIDEG